VIARAEGVLALRRSQLASPRGVAVAGILLGLIGFWLALPPLTTRSLVVPVLVGAAAIALGLWAVSRGERRAGWGAVVAGALGIVGGAFATRAAVPHLEAVITWSTLTAATLRSATPLTFAAIGGMFSERSGVVNIGLEGMMLIGAFFGAWGADRTGSWVAGILIGMASGGVLALVHALFSIHLRADQIVSGTAVNFLALGITGYVYQDVYGNNGTPNNLPEIPDVNLSWFGSIPPHALGHFLDDAVGQLNLMVWLSFVVLVLAWVVMFKTTIGLRIRAVGEHPRAADTVGISVFGVRYARRRLPLDRLRPLLQREHDRRTRLHRSCRPDLRPLAAVRRLRGRAALRFRERRGASPGERRRVGELRHALPGLALRPDADRRRRRHRPLDPARRYWPSLPEAVIQPRPRRSRSACWPSPRSRSRSRSRSSRPG
jgi:ribose/xylose/arabinose/galactoside ABC-type transport system permease subunit